MTELIIAAWSASAALLFLPLGRPARFARRGLGALISRVRGGEPRSAASLASTPADNAVPADSREPGAAALHEEAPVAGEGTPARLAGWATLALRLLRGPAIMVLYVVFIGGTVYLAPRFLVRVLNTEHPMAAVTSQSMFPDLKRGDLVFLQGVDKAADLRVGDIIAFDSGDGFGIHRIVRIDGPSITTKGDANLIADEPIVFDQVIGRTLTIRGRMAKIPYLGNIPLLFKQTSEEVDVPVESPPASEGVQVDVPAESPPISEREPDDRSRDRSR
ncbi:MAG: signal peptidase I [Chloroflexi bacterium]|nr:signal peptidase I [Chloroflexota bacterium]